MTPSVPPLKPGVQEPFYLKEYPDYEVVFAGGVASNSLLREKCANLPAVFCPPQFATDNAMGTAILTWRSQYGAADL